MPRISCWPALLALLMLPPLARAADELPPKPARYVTDSAGLLSSGVAAELTAKLAAYEKETSNQVLVAILPQVPDGYAMEDFTQRTAEAWKVGQKDRDNGVVLFVFPKARKMRIEVGYGLEGVLPDATAKRIIQNEIVPPFRSGYFDSGVTAGVDAILRATRGEYQGTGQTEDEHADDWGGPILAFLFFAVFIFINVLNMKKGTSYDRNGRRRGSWITWGGGGGGFSGGGGGFSSGGGGGSFSGGGGSFGGGGASGGW